MDGGGGAFRHESLAGEEMRDCRRGGPGRPSGEAGTEEQATNGPWVAGFQMLGWIPAGLAVLGAEDDSEHAAEVACGYGANAGGSTACTQCAFADAGVLAPDGQCARVPWAGSGTENEMSPASMCVHAAFGEWVVDDALMAYSMYGW